MDIGVMGGNGIPDEKFLKGFRIMRKTVNQGFNQITVFDFDAFIPGDRNFKLIKLKYVTTVFEFVAPNIAFIKD